MSALTENNQVFIDISIDNENAGRLVFELFPECPQAKENFRFLCTGEKGIGLSGKALHYKGSSLHRIIPGFMCQGGDITLSNGMGGESIYGLHFPDEFTHRKHRGFGTLSMANAGPNTNGSQFVICFAEAPWLDGKNVVVGQLISGDDVLREIEQVGSSTTVGTPLICVKIVDCGEFRGEE